MYAKIIGSKYEKTKDLDLAEIAKRIRQELKEAFRGEWKFRVRISRYSMGQSLDVDLVQVPAGMIIVEKAPNRDPGMIQWQLNARGRAAEQKAEAIVEAYNYDRSEPESDYFDKRFAGGVDLHTLAHKQWAELEGRGARQAERAESVRAAAVEAKRPKVAVTFTDTRGRRRRGQIMSQSGQVYHVRSEGTDYIVPVWNVGDVHAGGKRKRARPTVSLATRLRRIRRLRRGIG